MVSLLRPYAQLESSVGQPYNTKMCVMCVHTYRLDIEEMFTQCTYIPVMGNV